ncbi:MAG: MFS transporter, partial [Dehalococcoidia bacterium]|nr:MFS transporter [Dehalococcoidia bacterium]
YGGIGATGFYLLLFVQQTQGVSASLAGLALAPSSLMIFLFGGVFGAIADRTGPRRWIAGGPIVAGVGVLAFALLDATPSLPTVLVGSVLYGLGLAATVAPLSATVLSAADRRHAGLASGINNAVSRIAGLLAIGAVGVALLGAYRGAVDGALGDAPISPAARQALADAQRSPFTLPDLTALPPADQARLQPALVTGAVAAFRLSMGVCGALTMLSGVIAWVGLRARRDDPEPVAPAIARAER